MVIIINATNLLKKIIIVSFFVDCMLSSVIIPADAGYNKLSSAAIIIEIVVPKVIFIICKIKDLFIKHLHMLKI